MSGKRYIPAGPTQDDSELLRMVSRAFEVSGAQPLADDFVVSRVIARMTSALKKRVPPTRRFRYATAFVLLGATMGAAFAAVSVPAVRVWLHPVAPAPVNPPTSLKTTTPAPPPRPVPAAPMPLVPTTKTAPPKPRVAPPVPAAALPAAPPTDNQSPAARLFEEARRARSLGWDALAAKQFQSLIDEHQQSPEADISRLAAGRLYRRLGDHTRALAAFSSYCRLHPEGPLQEEAMAGTAESLSSLGRQQEAAAAWKALAKAHPQSPYVKSLEAP